MEIKPHQPINQSRSLLPWKSWQTDCLQGWSLNWGWRHTTFRIHWATFQLWNGCSSCEFSWTPTMSCSSSLAKSMGFLLYPESTMQTWISHVQCTWTVFIEHRRKFVQTWVCKALAQPWRMTGERGESMSVCGPVRGQDWIVGSQTRTSLAHTLGLVI